MARGYPDYISSSDKREVVIRPTLTSTTGHVICYDSFDNPNLAWSTAGSVGYNIYVDTANYYSAGSCLALLPPDGISGNCYVRRRFPVPESQIVGIECVFCMELGYDGYFTINLACKYNGTSRQGSLKFDQATGKWYIYYSSAYHEIPDSSMSFTANKYGFIRFKFIIDLSTQKYVSLTVNNHYFDLRNYSCSSPDATATEQLYTQIYNHVGDDATGYILWIDSFIITEE